ncbi:DUF1643 domain-containing protein [Marivita sp. GX14005]|nr:DUF1643 domain-containing protein [Marivita sp. GX14005]MCL3881366.1 DUF1643 domain-containing protein [Marivita sp. GX14005]
MPDHISDGLVCRTHDANGCLSRVWYSKCARYRYGLSRRWDETRPALLFIMLNPSTADEFRNDPTVARCETRARRMGFGAVAIANIFAFRATKPTDLRQAETPIGAMNDAVLRHWSSAAGLVVAAWGVHGAYLDRAAAVIADLPERLHHLGLTKDGHPRHPLYVSFRTEPVEWPRGTADR